MKISKLTIAEIVRSIDEEKLFEAQDSSAGFQIKIARYAPFCCTSVHSGGKLRPELQRKIAINDYQRWYEEDPFTDDFIKSMPITIIGLDSRYEYDLNRAPNECIYTEAWGKMVWKRKLSATEIKTSKQKHANYYAVLHALITKLEQKFGACVVYDIHSYNHKRWEREVPLFNVGTERIDNVRFAGIVDNWADELAKVALTGIENTIALNDVFRGLGYNLEYITQNFKSTLVLATEIKKVYCDELTGDIYPKIIKELQQQLKIAILNNANMFSQKLGNWRHNSSLKLLGKNVDDNLLKVDKRLHSLLKNFELLATVNPSNTVVEKNKFFKNKFTKTPVFNYNPVKVNAYSLKQDLLSLPIQDIQDISIRSLYESVVNSYFDKIDMVRTLNSPKFLYNSLRYFGRPSKTDLQNASYLLLLPDIPGEAKKEPVYDAVKAMQVFKTALDEYGIKAKIELSNMVISQVMVLNSKRTIYFQPKATFKRKELQALIEHEIGIHMVTTMNSNIQQLKLFNVGLPVNTLTQEGLAILAEYLSGNLTLRRLKKFALRALVVDMMCSGADFIESFNVLRNEYDLDPNEAFNLTTRIFRGGGFTKDYLYLAGFVKVLRFWEDHHDLSPLLVGKTSLQYYSTIEEMIGREMVTPPQYITRSISEPRPEVNNPIYNYILGGLK
jgi:uncharacterized protein (TIGR02421 family)